MRKKDNIAIIHKDEYFLMPPTSGLPIVRRVAKEHWSADFYLQRRVAEGSFVAFVQKGHVRLTDADDNVFFAKPGSVFHLPSGRRYVLEVPDPEGAHLVIVILSSGPSLDLLSKYLPVRCPILPLADPGRVETLFYRMLEAAEKKGIHTPDIAGALALPILLTINQEFRSHRDSADPTFALFTRCRVYVENNWRTIQSINDVPQAIGISQPYMARLFKKYENCTPHQFLLRQKMNYALYELQHDGSTVSELAFELGFSDPYSFSKTFKRIMGKAPSHMRGEIADM